MSEKTAVEWLGDHLCDAPIVDYWGSVHKAKQLEQKQHREKWQEGWDDAFDLMDYTKKKGLEIKKNDLKRQLFIGKVSEILGADKTVELLKEVNNEIL